MTIWTVLSKEIWYRPLAYSVAVTTVSVAVAGLITAHLCLAVHDRRTDIFLQERVSALEELVSQRQAQANKRATESNEFYRKIMLKFGYNLMIVPKGQKLTDIQVKGEPHLYMDQESVRILSESGIMTVRHLLPIIQKKQLLIAGRQRLEVFLIGTQGEVPLSHRIPKKPLLDTVEYGKIILGHAVAQDLALETGSTVLIADHSFTVSKVYPSRDPRNDASAWINLKQGQELLGQPEKINGILALSCLCYHAQLTEIIKDIEQILPGTHVQVRKSDAVIRYESRVRAAQEANDLVKQTYEQGMHDIDQQKQQRKELKQEIQAVTLWLIPVILITAVVSIALLAFSNVRQRQTEIAVLRALGFQGQQIMLLFLGKAACIGIVGALVGYIVGYGIAANYAKGIMIMLFSKIEFVSVLVITPVIVAGASLAPALIAAQQDPAEILQKE